MITRVEINKEDVEGQQSIKNAPPLTLLQEIGYGQRLLLKVYHGGDGDKWSVVYFNDSGGMSWDNQSFISGDTQVRLAPLGSSVTIRQQQKQ